ncbi:MAG: hypothetical protein HQL21_09575 [Candidatus Omnitrophica bacterium]|nr:hypothetical protein [Candidatus Omnitrophota bacterium]
MVLVLGLLSIGLLSRFLPHAPNFSPVLAIALFGGVYLRRSQALWLPLVLMIVSDLVIGLHATIAFTWGSVLLTSLLGLWVRQNPTAIRMVWGAVTSAVLFFVITNFGSWLAFYPQTQEGFISCYTLAIPFFRMNLLSTLCFSGALFGTYEFMVRRMKDSRLAPVLLNK